MLIVRGVNVFRPRCARWSAGSRPTVRASIRVRPREPRGGAGAAAPVTVELARAHGRAALADAIREQTARRLVVQTASTSCPRGACSAASTSRARGAVAARKLQTQGVHHITLVGADRQTSIDFWRACSGCPSSSSSRTSTRGGEPSLLRPGDGRLITIFTNEEREADPRPHLDDPAACAHRLRGLAGELHPGGRAPRRARHQPHAVKDRGFMDSIYFEDPLGLLIELVLVSLRAPRAHARRRAVRGAQDPGRAWRLQHRPGPSRRRGSRCSSRARGSRSRTTGRRSTLTVSEEDVWLEKGQHLTPSVNNLTLGIFCGPPGSIRGGGRAGQDGHAGVRRRTRPS